MDIFLIKAFCFLYTYLTSCSSSNAFSSVILRASYWQLTTWQLTTRVFIGFELEIYLYIIFSYFVDLFDSSAISFLAFTSFCF